MKSFHLFVVLFFTSHYLFAKVDTLAYRQIAKEVQKKYAPDKRTSYFNFQLKGDSVFLESNAEVAINDFLNASKHLNQQKLKTTFLPSKTLNGFHYAVVNVSVSNHRSTPSHSAELMTQSLLGTPLKILKKQDGFYLVQTPDQYLGWTDASIKPMDELQFMAWKNVQKIIFTADFGHSYGKPSIAAPRISDLVNGNILQLLGVEKNFYKVAYPDGRIAYITKSQASLYTPWVNLPQPNASAILAAAKTMIGVPYLWGGTSVKGVDCSGFTKTAYFLNGVIIPRDASQQALVGKPIDVMENDTVSVEKCLKNLLPGDLLFFSLAKRKGINGGRITHTAIYMGNGEFIQSAGMVKINSLVPTAANYDASQTPTIVSARRYLTAIGESEITRINEHNWYK